MIEHDDYSGLPPVKAAAIKLQNRKRALATAEFLEQIATGEIDADAALRLIAVGMELSLEDLEEVANGTAGAYVRTAAMLGGGSFDVEGIVSSSYIEGFLVGVLYGEALAREE